jgi:hypothetical protein
MRPNLSRKKSSLTNKGNDIISCSWFANLFVQLMPFRKMWENKICILCETQFFLYGQN